MGGIFTNLIKNCSSEMRKRSQPVSVCHTPAWEPEFDNQDPCKHVAQSTVVHTCNSNAREDEKKRSLWHTGQNVKNTC